MVDLTYYTDPLCSWSWALEPQWRRLRYELGDQLTWRYRMGGLLPDWETYEDPVNVIRRPIQMGAHWVQVSEMSGMPLASQLWAVDPPASSYRACLAVKAAERQGPDQGDAYLRRLRKVVMLEGQNPARPAVLLAVAESLVETSPQPNRFDVARFARDLQAPETADDFRDDLKDVRYRSIGRFPSLIIRPSAAAGGRAVIVVGYRPYDLLWAALTEVAPDLRRVRVACDAVAYVRQWGRVIAREVAEAIGGSPAAATEQLDAAVTAGTLGRTPVPGGATAVYVPLPAT